MLIALAILIIVVIIYGPQFWIRHVMNKYGNDLQGMPGTGGELATHLISRFEIEAVSVEETQLGDHYDDRDKMVRLSPSVFKGKSLTAVAVAAHEVGHAIQYHRKEGITKLRKRLTPLATIIEKIAIAIFLMVPVVAAVVKVPHVALITAIAGVLGILTSVLIQLIILPLEWDASFNKALPILIEGEYIAPEHYPAVKSVLRAAAFTYVAATLADLVRLGRWIAILRGAIR